MCFLIKWLRVIMFKPRNINFSSDLVFAYSKLRRIKMHLFIKIKKYFLSFDLVFWNKRLKILGYLYPYLLFSHLGKLWVSCPEQCHFLIGIKRLSNLTLS